MAEVNTETGRFETVTAEMEKKAEAGDVEAQRVVGMPRLYIGQVFQIEGVNFIVIKAKPNGRIRARMLTAFEVQKIRVNARALVEQCRREAGLS